MIELPKWKGWTVDLRLKQFRKVNYDENRNPLGVEMWSFDSQEGKDIFYDYCVEMEQYHDEQSRQYIRYQLDIENGDLDDEMLDVLAEEIVKEV